MQREKEKKVKIQESQIKPPFKAQKKTHEDTSSIATTKDPNQTIIVQDQTG